MKTFACFLLGICLSLPVFANDDADAPQLPPEELDKLVAPIALYPDSLIALVLPASTTSAEVVLAARYLASGGEPDAIENQPWSESVKSLARFPDLVAWMDENLAWTQQMGEVFETQPADVMNAIQRLREQARASGLLTDTPQQKIVMQESVICIVPAEPDIIYVPRYDPEILWMRRPYHGSFMTFGLGFGIGSWLHFDCDWFGRSVWMHHRNPGWVYRPGWRRPTNEVHVVVGSPWRPDFRHNHHARPMHSSMTVAVRPHVMSDRPREYHRGPGSYGRPDNRGDHGRSERSVTPPSSDHRMRPPMPPSHMVTPPPTVRPPHLAGPQSRSPAPFRQPGGPMSPPNGFTPPTAGRSDHRSDRPERFGPPSSAPRASVPASPPNVATPPQPGRPPHVAGPQAQPPRERPQGRRGPDSPSPSMQTPRPPSHTPPAVSQPRPASAPREAAPSVPPAPAARPSQPRPTPKSDAQESTERQHDGTHGGRNSNRR